MRRILALLLLLALFLVPAAAYEISEDADLETVLTAYMKRNGLKEGNFALSYYNTVTGESYAVNDTVFMPAASTFKLPLNMYYYEMERDGKIDPDAVIPYAKGAGGEFVLRDAHMASLVYSNNEMSLGMLYNLGVFAEYKQQMRDAYFHMPEEDIHYLYYEKNYYCTNMMMDALKYLYAHSEDFEEMLGYMKQAQPDEYFRACVTEIEVAHKFGWFEGSNNDVGIFYTEEPFLLAVYTKDLNDDTILCDVARLVTDYNIAKTTVAEQEEPEPAPEEPAAPNMDWAQVLEFEMVPLPGAEEVTEEEPETELAEEPEPVPEIGAEEAPVPEETPEPQKAFVWWMPLVALGVFAVGGGGTLLIVNPKRLAEKMKEDEEEEDEEPKLPQPVSGKGENET